MTEEELRIIDQFRDWHENVEDTIDTVFSHIESAGGDVILESTDKVRIDIPSEDQKGFLMGLFVAKCAYQTMPFSLSDTKIIQKKVDACQSRDS